MAVHAHIEATFPDLRGRADATGRGEGSTKKAAIARAIADLLRQKHVRGKRINSIRMRVTLTAVQKVAEQEANKAAAA